MLITSPSPGEGKSTLASNLAIAMAEAGQRVLMLDADLREPAQHRLFSAAMDKGITSIIAGRSTLERAIQTTAIKGLEILPCGPIPLNPAEVVNNQTFADVLKWVMWPATGLMVAGGVTALVLKWKVIARTFSTPWMRKRSATTSRILRGPVTVATSRCPCTRVKPLAASHCSNTSLVLDPRSRAINGSPRKRSSDDRTAPESGDRPDQIGRSRSNPDTPRPLAEEPPCCGDGPRLSLTPL